MTGGAAFVWDDRLAAYDFGPAHPLAPVRLELAVGLAGDLGLLARPNVDLPGLSPASDADLLRVHTADYLDAVRRADPAAAREDLRFGLGTPDNPVFPGMHDASALVAGASLAAMRAVVDGGADHAVNLAGGLHHAMPASASGFCVYNDPAIAIAWALDHGVERIAYVDVDVHHGDGVQAVFWDDPRVLTISIHETGQTLFPGTGFPSEIGGPDARGSAINVALPAGTGDAGWLRAFDAVVPRAVEAFAPQLLVSQHGCDSHRLDPLAHLELTVDGQVAAYRAVHDLAHRCADGRWLAVGGGGYAIVQVVPRSWAHLVGVVVGQPVPADRAIPATWSALARARTGQRPPVTMTDLPDSGGSTSRLGTGDDEVADVVSQKAADVDAAVDSAIAATEHAVGSLSGGIET
jgi:acetoin utilization protein AcuC